jgi:hypothetical protein
MKCVTKKLVNKTMDEKTYALRQKVMALIYEAKGLYPPLPRIEVRVTENDKKILGVGRMGERVIWITEDFVASRSTVFHEILHAVFNQGHVSSCPLMAPEIDPKLGKKVCDKLFLNYARSIR